MFYSLKDIYKLYRVKATKALSQNFIFDQALLKRIAAVPRPVGEEGVMVEVGPAAGNLSRALLGRADCKESKVVLVEKDARFKPALEQLKEKWGEQRVRVLIEDAQNASRHWFDGFNPRSLLIFGNLPFAIATPLTLQLIKEFSLRHRPGSLFEGVKQAQMVLMFQEEVARKFAAKVGTANYGRLAVLARSFGSVEYVERVPAAKFTPKPKVDAGIVKFDLDFTSPTGIFDDIEGITNTLFRHRNKKMSLDPKLDIDPNWRPHHLSPLHIQRILQFNKQLLQELGNDSAEDIASKEEQEFHVF